MTAAWPVTFGVAVLEAEAITAEAASAEWVDEARREFDRRQMLHGMRYGFDYPGQVSA